MKIEIEGLILYCDGLLFILSPGQIDAQPTQKAQCKTVAVHSYLTETEVGAVEDSLPLSLHHHKTA